MNESIWFIELESAFCLLIGRLISYGIISSPLCLSEIYNKRWLKSKLFSSGIEKLEDKSIFGKDTKIYIKFTCYMLLYILLYKVYSKVLSFYDFLKFVVMYKLVGLLDKFFSISTYEYSF